MKGLPIIDDFEINLETGEVTSWACAHNNLLAEVSAKEPLKRCPAPDGACPRGFTKTFECRSEGL